jgi:hypothetical protein
MEESKLQVFETEVFTKLFETKEEEVSKHFRMLHNEELRDFYRFPSIVKGKVVPVLN